jgi:hypothetical protein
MASTIITKYGSGAPLASDLVRGELAVDTELGRLYTETSGGSVIEIGTNPTTLAVDTDTLVVDATNNRVGIGTASPSTSLDVVRSGVQPLRIQSTSGTEVAINMVNTGGNVQLEAHSGNFNIDADAVGIGTTSPAELLHIESGTNGEQVDIRFRGLTTSAGAGRSANIGFDPDPNDTGTATEAQLYLSADTTNKTLVATASGNVGIGTSPDANSKLHLLDDTASLDDYTIHIESYSPAIVFQDISATATDFAIQADNSALMFRYGDASTGTQLASEAMRIDSSGRVLVGQSSNTGSANADNLVVGTGSGNNGLTILSGTDSGGTLAFADSGADEDGFISFNHASQFMQFGTASNERMRIDSSGNLLVGNPTPTAKLSVNGQGAFGSEDASGNGIYLYVSGALADNSYMSRSSAGTGTTTWYIGNQSITTSSDLRLKDNIVDSQRNAVEIINNLRVVDHTWNDPSDQSINNKNSRGVWTGLIAQEAVEHIPWLVNRPLEDVDENGNKNYWHMDYGYSVPLLIKAIQEQQDLIESLTARIAALEGAN